MNSGNNNIYILCFKYFLSFMIYLLVQQHIYYIYAFRKQKMFGKGGFNRK